MSDPHLCLGDLCDECDDLEPMCPLPSILCRGRGELLTATSQRHTYRCRRCSLEFWIEPGVEA